MSRTPSRPARRQPKSIERGYVHDDDGVLYEDHRSVLDHDGWIETGLFTHDHRKLLRKVNPRSIGFAADMDVGPAYAASDDLYEAPETPDYDADE